jgi:hypothetical protein
MADWAWGPKGRVVKNWLKGVGNAISNAVDTAAGAVQTVMSGAGSAVADVFETVGSGIQHGCNALGRALAGVPWIGRGLNTFFRHVGRVAAGLCDFVGAVVKASLGLVGGVCAGLLRVVGGGIGGLLSGNGRVALRGLGDIGSSLAGAIIVIGGKLISATQTILTLERERALTEEERETLRRVFRKSVSLYNVRLVERKAGIFSLNGDPFTLGNTIYMKGTSTTSWLSILVHECTHVWQYEHLGARYTSDAIWAQQTANAYKWRAEMTDGKAHWRDFNREAEAEFVEDVYDKGQETGKDPTGKGEFYADEPVGPNVEFRWDKEDLTTFAAATTAYVRGNRSWRLSQFI